MENKTKKCNKCGEVKVVNSDNFYKKSGGKYGVDAVCKPCQKEYQKEYSKKNKEKLKTKARKRYKENKSYFEQYYENNKEKILQERKRYRKENKESLIVYHREYRSKNKEKISDYKSIWRRVNSNKVNISNQRRKARLRELPHDFTASEEKEMFNYFKNSCCLSGCKENIQLDHALPLNKGGGTTKQNMIPLNATLNASKMDSNLFEWYEDNKERFNLSDERFYKTIKYLAEMNDMDIGDYIDYYNERYVAYARGDYHLQ